MKNFFKITNKIVYESLEIVSPCYRCMKFFSANIELFFEETIRPAHPYRGEFARVRPFLSGHKYCDQCANLVIKEMNELLAKSPSIKIDTGEVLISSNVKIIKKIVPNEKTYYVFPGFSKY